MPYIKPERRTRYDDTINELVFRLLHCPIGDLNYVITSLIATRWVQSPCYQTIVEITGMLNDAKTEFERQVVAKYEDQKILENGSIYPEVV